MKKIVIRNIRHIKELEFEIPTKAGVYVLAGGNGAGKTTLLTTLHKIVDKDAFKRLFINTNEEETSFAGEVEYTVGKEKKTYRNGGARWTPKPKKGVNEFFKKFGFSATDFLSAAGDGRRFFSQKGDIPTKSFFKAEPEEFQQQLNELLETNKFSDLMSAKLKFRGKIPAKEQRNRKVYAIKNRNTFYTERNFSLGELLVLNTIAVIEDIEENSMLVIDEVEMALHPRLQMRLYKYLEQKAKEKNLVILLSTHSSSLIKIAKNIYYLENDGSGKIEVLKGVCPTYVLKEVAIEEDEHPEQVFFVEDVMARKLLEATLDYYFNLTGLVRPTYKVLPIGGYTNILNFAEHVEGYLFDEKIGQHIFFDEDVKDALKKIKEKKSLEKGEEKLLKQFKNKKKTINYLPITPEHGLWNYLKSGAADDNFKEQYGLRLKDLVEKIEQQIPPTADATINNSDNRNKAKKQLASLLEKVATKKSIQEDAVLDTLFQFYVESYYSEAQHKNSLKTTFGKIFPKKTKRN
ncbi:ATP-dependent nuclease [Saprospira grandis]|uniref:ATP-dependent nuclease n=1 Tax=Saprospira grandis TaxID=1008 RepID=UPI0022DE3E72|nr:AAA family ATPase [Saprospira grandis]WBM74828.1 ATP-binding protein [Saprospira grandis]